MDKLFVRPVDLVSWFNRLFVGQLPYQALAFSIAFLLRTSLRHVVLVDVAARFGLVLLRGPQNFVPRWACVTKKVLS